MEIKGCNNKECSCPCLRIRNYVGTPLDERYVCADCKHAITEEEVLKDILTEDELAAFRKYMKGASRRQTLKRDNDGY